MSAALGSMQPAPQQESKSSKKKKAKAEVPAKLPSATSDGETAQAVTDGHTNGGDAQYESPYIKELYKYVCLCALIIVNLNQHANQLLQPGMSVALRRSWSDMLNFLGGENITDI